MIHGHDGNFISFTAKQTGSRYDVLLSSYSRFCNPTPLTLNYDPYDLQRALEPSGNQNFFEDQ